MSSPPNVRLRPKADIAGRQPSSAVDSRVVVQHSQRRDEEWREMMKLYRINKVTKVGGVVVKKKDVLAASDSEALQRAKESRDCPVCEVLRDGQQVGEIV